MKIKDLLLLDIFRKVSHLKSFSKAAKKIGVTPSAVSKKISQLESNLGISLFHRTTRKISLTDNGKKLLKASEHILDEVKLLENSFEQEKTNIELEGVIRISCAETYLNSKLISIISKFSKLHPKVKVELILSNSYLDLIDEDIDIAIRIYKPTDSSLKSFKIDSNELIFCASPEYLKNNEKIKNLNDLKQHSVMYLKSHGEDVMEKTNEKVKNIIKPTPVSANSGEVINQFCIDGYCVALRSKWDVERYLVKGELVEVKLDDTINSRNNVYVLFQDDFYLSRRVRVFLDLLKNQSKSY